MPVRVQFGVMDVKTREVYALRFPTKTEALVWLGKETRIRIDDCEIVKRTITWSDWHPTHDN